MFTLSFFVNNLKSFSNFILQHCYQNGGFKSPDMTSDEMETRPQTSKEYFKTLQIIYYALITGQVIFGLVTLYLRKMIGLDTGLQDLTGIFLYLVPVFIIGGYFLSRILFKSNLNTAINKTSLIEKMSDYRAALVIRYALLEGPTFFAIFI
jgi:hypothetical protein